MKKALLIIDYQNDFVSSDGKVGQKLTSVLGKETFLRLQNLSLPINKLISFWKKNNDSVIYVKSDYNEVNNVGRFREFRASGAYGNTGLVGTKGHELYNISESADLEVVKNFFDAFINTNLDNYLKEHSITDLYLCGVNTDFCVFHTAITAMIKGYNVYIIIDATDTITKNKQVFLEYLEKYIGVILLGSERLLDN